jgi:hypothetical protein
VLQPEISYRGFHHYYAYGSSTYAKKALGHKGKEISFKYILIKWYIVPRLDLRSFGAERINEDEKAFQRLTAYPRIAFWMVSKSAFLDPGGSGFVLLQRSAHPHCPRLQTLRVCLLWLGQRRRQATVRLNIDSLQ